MSAYAIAIGGSGARCLEAVVHLCAIGLGPEKLFILVLDPDAAHGNIERLRKQISSYSQARKDLGMSYESPIFGTEISVSKLDGEEKISWSPVDHATGNTLRDYFGYDTLTTSTTSKLAGEMCKLLYADSELKLTWDQGFRGRASIGAPVMASMKEKLGQRPWYDMIFSIDRDINAGDLARVFIFSSIFGATGASGFPTAGKILRDQYGNDAHRANFKLAGALLLPYFSFAVPPNQSGLYAKPQHFLANTKAALKHYAFVWQQACPYDSIYFMGDQKSDDEGREFALGGNDQDNPSHFVELLAGLAFLHFCAHPQNGFQQNYIGRSLEDVIEWADLPARELRNSLLYFTTFAIAFRQFYLPLLKDHRLEKKARYLPWYSDHFVKRGETLTGVSTVEQMENVSAYLTSCIRWLKDLHTSAPSRQINLLNRVALKPPDEAVGDADFRALLHGELKSYAARHKYGYDGLWNHLCGQDPDQGLPSAPGRFVQLVYRACASFCQHNYPL